MDIRSFSLLSLLLLSVSSAQPMEQKDGRLYSCLNSAKDTVIEFSKKSPHIVTAIGITVATAVGAVTYIYSKKTGQKSPAGKPQTKQAQENTSVASNIEVTNTQKKETSNQEPVAKLAFGAEEIVDVSNDSDYEFSIEIKVPARTKAFLQMSKQSSVVKK